MNALLNHRVRRPEVMLVLVCVLALFVVALFQALSHVVLPFWLVVLVPQLGWVQAIAQLLSWFI